MKKIFKYLITIFIGTLLISCSNSANKPNDYNNDTPKPLLDFDFDTHNEEYIVNHADSNEYKVEYLFNKSNADRIFKAPSDPLFKTGVGESGKSLYLDGHSTKMKFKNITMPKDKLTISTYIAPRGFENVFDYNWESIARGHTRLTSLLNRGNIEMGEGFLFGYGRLGLWGIQLCLLNNETNEEIMVGFYDPLNTLKLYEWNHISVTFDGETGYIGLFYNGERAYEAYIADLVNTEIIYPGEDLYLGYYCSPMIEFGCDRQLPAGLIDNFRFYDVCLTPSQIRTEYQRGLRNNQHPALDFDDVKEDRAQYEGDRYRPIYHGIPSAVWMNEPHAPLYYKGMYHLFYQHNPIGPYWSQIRWGHLASPDMIHWESVKDAVVPTPGVCPEGIWTGGALIGPDGKPWLAITAGTNRTTWTGQNVAFAHCVDPDDPYLTDWVIEDKVVITQPNDDSMGEREQFRDPFVWYDEGIYYMLVSTSIPGRGGSANIFTSLNMRDWEHHGYVYECPFDLYPEQGAHWECVIMLPISSKDGSIKKWILFDCPQYTVDGYVVDCYYWVGQFNKTTKRFIPDSHQPRLFDFGKGIYTGQTGFCYLTEEDIENGKTRYDEGRTVIFSLAQGKSAGTNQNILSGWAHNIAMPVDIYLDDDGTTVLREPIPELSSAYGETLFVFDGPQSLGALEMNNLINDIRGDALEIKFKMSLTPNEETYNSGLHVRYNKNTVNGVTERTAITFNENGVYVNRLISTVLDYVDRGDTNTYLTSERDFDVRILIDRSLLEVYINSKATITTRIYPKYGNSDYLNFFDNGGNMKISSLSIKNMNSVYFDEVTPAYYGNTGNLGE